jgi:hypothetical protein
MTENHPLDFPKSLFFEQRGLHSQASTGNLDVNAGRRPVVVQHEGQTNHPLVADRSNFGRLAVRHGVHQGADAGLDEVDKSDGLVCAVKRLPVRQRYPFKMRAKPGVIPGGQQTEQSVGMRLRSLTGRHHFAASFESCAHEFAVATLTDDPLRFSSRRVLLSLGYALGKHFA